MFEKIIAKIRDTFFAERTKNIYGYPVSKDIRIKNILYDWPSHEGPYKGAVDFAVDLGTPVLAPLDGNVVNFIDSNTEYGAGEKYASYVNYITIAHANGEFSQLAHLAKDSVRVKVGEFVRKGQQIAVTGLNGWMEEPFLEHVHMLVFKLTSPAQFQGLKIRFDSVRKAEP